MNYENLALINNKPTCKWTAEDVAKWLEFIGHENFKDSFRSAGIDGSILKDLEAQDLENELGIKSKIIRKKFMNWIEKGFTEFDQLFYTNKQNICLNESLPTRVAPPQLLRKNTSFQTIQPVQRSHSANSSGTEMQTEPSFTAQLSQPSQASSEKRRQLIISPEEGTPQSSTFCISQNGGKIGRHSSNSILVLEESVSRHHAEIRYVKELDKFTIQDLKSSTGTYIKIKHRMSLQVGITIELGSYQLYVQSINCTNEQADLCFMITEGVSTSRDIRFSCKPGSPNSFKIGRQNTNEVFFPDTHLSGIHAVVSYLSGTFMIEDMSSTNGTWLRLPSSESYELSNDSIFKVGNVCIYSCRYSDHSVPAEKPHSDSCCIICYVNDRDALMMPCKHNLVCLGCAKQVRKCPVCRLDIVETIKIYK